MKKKAKRIANMMRNEYEDVLKVMSEDENRGVRYDVYSDGSNKDGVNGCAWVVVHGGEVVKTGKLAYKNTDSVEAEMLAMVFGIKECPEGASVDVYCDCQSALRKIQGRAVQKYIFNLLKEVTKYKAVRYHYVRSHNDNSYNSMADSLAYAVAALSAKQG